MTFAIEHADAVDSLFVGNCLHDLVGGFAVVIEHELPGRAGYAARKLVGAEDHGFYQLFLLGPEIQIAADRANGDDQDR